MKRVQKKAIVLCLLLSLVLSLTACGAPETGGSAAESREAGETGTESVRDEDAGAEEAQEDASDEAASQDEAGEGAATAATAATASTAATAAAAVEIPRVHDLDPIDYGDPASWAYFALGEEKDVDVFLIPPTVDTLSPSNSVDLNDKLKGRFVNALDMERGIFEETCRMYAPYYRQMSINAYGLPADQRIQAREVAYRDIADAFQWYLDNANDGRPVILAGFSQGGELCLEIMKDFYGGNSEEAVGLRDRLVAVYAMGWRLTEEMTEEFPQLVPAKGETDTGVVICFDCEDGTIDNTIIIPRGVKSLSINPLNWETDDTMAERTLNKGAVMENGGIPIPEFCGAYIGDRGQIVVTDIDRDDYPPVLDLFPNGSYHLYDYMFFFTNLKDNVALRSDTYLEAHGLKKDKDKDKDEDKDRDEDSDEDE